MFEPSFLCILRKIEEKYGQNGKKMALHLHDQKIFEVVSQMKEADFTNFRDIVYKNLEEVKDLFRQIYQNIGEMNSDNYHDLIPKKTLSFMDDYYQYYYTELDNSLRNYFLNEENNLKLYSEIYDKFDIFFQQFYEQITRIFSRKDYLVSEFDNPYSQEQKLLSLKHDLELMLGGSVTISRAELLRIIQIFEDTNDYESDFFKYDLENIKLLIDDIKETKESRQQYISKVLNVRNEDFEKACDIVNGCLKIFMEKKNWQRLEEIYRNICSLVQEGLDNILDDDIHNILNEMDCILDISLDHIQRGKLYKFYNKRLLEKNFRRLVSDLFDYNSKLYSQDLDLLVDRVKKMMSLELIAQADIRVQLINLNENSVLELLTLYNKRLQMYCLYSNPNSNNDGLISGLQAGEYDSLYDTILERLQREDYFTMLVTIPSNCLATYFDIHSMLSNSRSIREEECMASVLEFAKQKVKVSNKN